MFRLFPLLLVLLSLVPGARAQPRFIYTATDLADTTPGEDLWQYSYRVEGFSFQINQGFSVFFDHLLYRNLQSPSPVTPDWNVLVVQPDLQLPDAGFYDALAMQTAPSLADPFRVNFIWQGQGIPAEQPFTFYDTDFSTLFAGATVVPEPNTVWLLSVALAAGAIWARGRKRLVRNNGLTDQL